MQHAQRNCCGAFDDAGTAAPDDGVDPLILGGVTAGAPVAVANGTSAVVGLTEPRRVNGLKKCAGVPGCCDPHAEGGAHDGGNPGDAGCIRSGSRLADGAPGDMEAETFNTGWRATPASLRQNGYGLHDDNR